MGLAGVRLDENGSPFSVRSRLTRREILLQYRKVTSLNRRMLGRVYIFPGLQEASVVRSKGVVGRTP